jgi:tetratricopeptide (TPR) repeat protein
MLSGVTFRTRRIGKSVAPPIGTLLVALMLLGASAPAPAADQDSVSRTLAAAAAAERAGNYAAAAVYYRQVLQAAVQQNELSSVFPVRVQLAKDYFFLRRYEDSLKALEPVLVTSGPTRATATLVAGLDNIELNRLPQAITNLREAVALDPRSGTARLSLGDAFARSGQLEEAAKEYREQLSRTPSVADAWYKLGVVYSSLSAQTVQDAERRNPTDSIVRMLVAERLLEKGASAVALPPLVAILHTSPVLPGLRADLGAALLDLGSIREASEQFRSELSRDPESPKALLGLAEADALNADWQTAFNLLIHLAHAHPRQLQQELEVPLPKPLREAWEQGHLAVPQRWADTSVGKLWSHWLRDSGTGVRFVVQRSDAGCEPPEASTSARKPGIWLTQGCYEKLRTDLEGRNAQGVATLAKLAEADFRLGDYERARAEAGKLARRQPGNGWAAYWLAQSYEALADRCFRSVASMNPGSARVQQMLAQLDAGRFHWSQAEEEYKAAIRLAPNLPDLHLGLGTVYWQAGDWAQAEPELETTLELDPASAVANYELGDCYVAQHRWPAAIAPLRRAIVDPSVSYRAHLDLGRAEEESGHSRQALQDLLPVAQEDRDGVLHYRLALLYRRLGEAVSARQALARSQALRESSAQAAQQHIQQAEQELRQLQVSSRAPR